MRRIEIRAVRGPYGCMHEVYPPAPMMALAILIGLARRALAWIGVGR